MNIFVYKAANNVNLKPKIRFVKKKTKKCKFSCKKLKNANFAFFVQKNFLLVEKKNLCEKKSADVMMKSSEEKYVMGKNVSKLTASNLPLRNTSRSMTTTTATEHPAMAPNESGAKSTPPPPFTKHFDRRTRSLSPEDDFFPLVVNDSL